MLPLDHVGIIVPSLRQAASLFEQLGFTLTRRAEHNRTNAAGIVESAGSAQQSIMFEQGYIELQEITDPQNRHILSAAAAKHFGLHIVAFGIDDAQAAYETLRSRMSVTAPMHWARAIAEPDLHGDAQFDFFVQPYDTGDESYFCWVVQVTPQLMRSPRLVSHANSVVRLDGIWIAARDAADRARIEHRYLNAGGIIAERDESRVVFRFDRSRVTIALETALPDAFRGNPLGMSGRVVAVELAAPDASLIAGRARACGLDVAVTPRFTAVRLPSVYNLSVAINPA